MLELADLDGEIGFSLSGVDAGEYSGGSVASAGDINGDGVGDVIIGATLGSRGRGAGYVVFGRDARMGGFPSTVELADLDGTDGFRVEGVDTGDYSGWSVASAGDVNGDGIGDVIIGAPKADPVGRPFAGQSYVIFGRDTAVAGSFPPIVQLADLDGTDGFRLEGVHSSDYSGQSVASAGDVNGDGVGDVIIGAAGSPLFGYAHATASFVFFGRDTSAGETFPAVIQLADLDGSNGFRLDGVELGDQSGRSVASAGDVNNDGLDDIIIAAPGARNGESYVVYGRDAAAGAAFPSALPLADLDGTTGFRLVGPDADEFSGDSVASAGDVNGDGIADIIISARLASPHRSWVVFGRDASSGVPFPASFFLADLDGTTGFGLEGVDIGDGVPSVASAGDLNGDRVGDIIIGAERADPGGRSGAGESYVVFGRDIQAGSSFPAAIQLADLDGRTGFTLNGVAALNFSGRSVASAGDVNGDGIGDIIIGAPSTGYSPEGGTSFVVYGRDLAPCRADVDGDGELTVFDFMEFCNLFDIGDPRADFDDDGAFTIFDFLAFQNAFDLGCP
ncbi:MAG: integrin alpha [Phycisphaerales bacterium]